MSLYTLIFLYKIVKSNVRAIIVDYFSVILLKYGLIFCNFISMSGSGLSILSSDQVLG